MNTISFIIYNKQNEMMYIGTGELNDRTITSDSRKMHILRYKSGVNIKEVHSIKYKDGRSALLESVTCSVGNDERTHGIYTIFTATEVNNAEHT
jgi:hypothetical protein